MGVAIRISCIAGLPHGVHSKSRLPMRNWRNSGDWLNRQRFFLPVSMREKSCCVRSRSRKESWSGAFW